MMIEGVHGDAPRAVLHGAERIRKYGAVEHEYAAATGGVAILDRGGDAVVRFTGPKVAEMLHGVVSGRIPQATAGGEAPSVGRAELQTVLTPKGRMISDLVLARAADGDDGRQHFWGTVPAAGLEGLSAHLRRFLPPRFAKFENVSERWARITVVGPEAGAAIAATVDSPALTQASLSALEPFEFIETGPSGDPRVRVLRSNELGEVPSFDLLTPSGLGGSESWTALTEHGAVPMGAAAFEALRIEAATPLYGIDMDDRTIPTEAGLEEIAIDHTKGCYTGQEVIVRIRDRGHVNRRLRRILLGDQPTPTPGTELRVEGLDRPAGEVRSAAWSPRYGQTVALAFIRREAWDGSDPQPEFRTA